MKIKSLRDYGPGIGLTKSKIYEARQGQKGWFSFIDDSGEEYAYPPHLFEIVEDEKKDARKRPVYRGSRQNGPKSGSPMSASGK